MVGIKLRDGEKIDIALRRFKRECERDGILREIRKREFYKPPSLVKKEKLAESRRRMKRLSRKKTGGRPGAARGKGKGKGKPGGGRKF